MAVEVGLSRAAEADVEGILDHIFQDNPRIAIRVCDRLRARCFELSEFPERGAVFNADVRRLVEGNYLIFYRLERDAAGAAAKAVILRILHGARNYTDEIGDAQT